MHRRVLAVLVGSQGLSGSVLLNPSLSVFDPERTFGRARRSGDLATLAPPFEIPPVLIRLG